MSRSREQNPNLYTYIFWIAFIFVLVLNVFVWLYVNQVERSFTQELRSRLTITNQLITRLIDESDINLIVPRQKTGLEYFYYQNLFDDIRERSDLQTVLLVTPRGELMVASPSLYPEHEFVSLFDDSLFRELAQGKTIVTDLKTIAGESFMTAYAPIQNLEGFMTAVLIIEAKAKFFDVLDILRDRLLIFSLINFLLIVIISAYLFKMIRRTIRYQTQIKEREHLVQLGTMAATVSHELRNPLNIIEATNDVIQKKYSAGDDEIFQYIPQEVKRLSHLIDDFLRFARVPQIKLGTLKTDELIQRLKTSLSADRAARIQIQQKLDDPSFISDARLLEQIILNLLLNALQASPDDQPVQLDLNLHKNRLQIRISDNGPGIPDEIREKVFDPFFTTKETGTGLGLAIARRLTELLQGQISINSRAVRGTEVELHFRSIDPKIFARND